MWTYSDPLHAQDPEPDAKAALRAKREVDDLKWIVASPQGRRFIARLLDRSAIFQSSFHTSGSIMAFSEGRKDLGRYLLAELLEHAPKQYSQLLNEYRNDD